MWYDASKQPRPGVVQPTKPASVNVYGGITCNGKTYLHCVTGTTNHKGTYENKQGQPARNITLKEYKDVLWETLLPGGQKLFSARGASQWTLQQDGDPCHNKASKVINEWNAQPRHASVIGL